MYAFDSKGVLTGSVTFDGYADALSWDDINVWGCGGHVTQVLVNDIAHDDWSYTNSSDVSS